MKAILISDHAKWCALMMNGEKKIEVRKSNVGKAVQKLIDEQGYAEFYVYCTKSNYLGYISNRYIGKVIFKFRCYKVEEILLNRNHFVNEQYSTDELDYEELLERSCLTYRELDDYLQCEIGYAIHISDLEIFDKPKELSEFKTLKRAKATDCFVCDVYQLTEMCIGKRCLLPKPLTKAPQSMCYIEVE